MRTDTRYGRESAFHDQAFGENTRAAADRYYAVTGASKRYWQDFIVAHCRDAAVLEYGCGPYSYASLMLPHGARVAGIDISPVALRQYRERVARVRPGAAMPCVMNAEALGFADASFDLVCGNGILHHLDIAAALAEVARVLKPGGRAIFLEPMGHNPLLRLYRHITPNLRTPDEHPLVAADFTTARRFFTRVETRFFHFQSLLAVPFRPMPFFDFMLAALDRSDRAVLDRFPSLGRYAWAVVLTLAEPRAGAVPYRHD